MTFAPNYRTVQKTWDLTGFWKTPTRKSARNSAAAIHRLKWPETVL